VIRSTPIAKRGVQVEVEAEAEIENEPARAVDADEAPRPLRAVKAVAGVRVGHELSQGLRRWPVLPVWLLMKRLRGEIVKRPKRKPKDDVSPPLAHTGTSILNKVNRRGGIGIFGWHLQSLLRQSPSVHGLHQ
jgi:hypothetical protein